MFFLALLSNLFRLRHVIFTLPIHRFPKVCLGILYGDERIELSLFELSFFDALQNATFFVTSCYLRCRLYNAVFACYMSSLVQPSAERRNLISEGSTSLKSRS